jgi:hypothetical protein
VTADRVCVFLDYQNVHLTARDLFATPASPAYFWLVHPLRLGELIAARRKNPSILAGVQVFRGRPNPERQPLSAAANDAQTAAWERDGAGIVRVHRRDLNYRGWPQIPAVEVAFRRTAPRIEVAAWEGARPLWMPAEGKAGRLPWCHFVSRADFEAVRDRTDYLARG